MARNIVVVRSDSEMRTVEQANSDLTYWMSKTPQERLAAVTYLVKQNLGPTQRMNRGAFSQRIRKP